MEIPDENATCDLIELCDFSPRQTSTVFEPAESKHAILWPRSSEIPSRPSENSLFETSPPLHRKTAVKARQDRAAQTSHPSISFSDFVKNSFIPDFVAAKRASGRAHFRAILKHVLPPETVNAAFGIAAASNQRTLSTISGWPYLDSVQLADVTPEMIRNLALIAVKHGYSIQTATHIRNVVRAVFSHALHTGCYSGQNPAALVRLPALPRPHQRTLTLEQLQQLVKTMRHPEKELALFTLLTEMSVVEICGLQWKFINLASASMWADGEFIPPKTIAVRFQHYRGEFSPIAGARRRFVRVPESICHLIAHLKNTRRQFTRPQDFVLAARNGSPVNAENIAMRRLKALGNSLGIPWLSWAALKGTRSALRSEFGKEWSREIENSVLVQPSLSHAPQ